MKYGKIGAGISFSETSVPLFFRRCFATRPLYELKEGIFYGTISAFVKICSSP